MLLSWNKPRYHESMETIYALKDPSTGEVRYIGKTGGKLAKRLWQHMASAARPDMRQRRLASWIRSLGGARPAIEALETDPPDGPDAAERRWIAVARLCGAGLTNMTDGGDGQSPGYRPSAEARRKNSESHKGKVLSEETKAKISAALTRHEVNEETRRKIGDANRGRRWTEEQRSAHSERNAGERNGFFGRTHTDEAKARMSRLGWHHSEETKAKMRAANTGYRHTEEAKEKIRQARLRRQVT